MHCLNHFIQVLFFTPVCTNSLTKSIDFYDRFLLLLLSILKRGRTILFLNMFKGGVIKYWWVKLPLRAMTSSLVVLKFSNFLSWHLNWWICFCVLKRRTLGVFRLIVRILCFTFSLHFPLEAIRRYFQSQKRKADVEARFQEEIDAESRKNRRAVRCHRVSTYDSSK